MTDGWYLLSNGCIYGPFDKQALSDEREAGRIADEDQISTDQTTWISLGEILNEAAATEQEDGAATPSPEQADKGIPEGPTGTRDRIVILGRRGAGKTVFMSTLQVRMPIMSTSLPIHARGKRHSNGESICRNSGPVKP